MLELDLSRCFAVSTAMTAAEQPIPPRLYERTSALMPNLFMSIAARLGVGVKQLRVVIIMSICRRVRLGRQALRPMPNLMHR